jgi:hypothetical protein
MSVKPASSRSRGQGSNSQRPRASTVFAAAFLAGAAAAVCVNRALDLHIAQTRPRVESESIFVALRSLPQGSPVTVWDVGLRDWPKAMLPTAAMRPSDSFDGLVLKYPLREGQPVLSVQLVKAAAETAPTATATARTQSSQDGLQPDLWTPTAAVDPTALIPPATEETHSVAAITESASGPASSPVTNLVVPSQAPTDPVRTGVPPIEFAATPVSTDIETTPAPTQQQATHQQPTLAATDAELEAAADLAASGSRDSSPFTPHEQQSLPTETPPVIRYLVVPERIALQADRSFLPEASVTAPVEEKPREEVQTRDLVQPKTRAAQSPRTRPQSTAPVPLPEATMKAVSQEPAEPYKPSMLRSMFPKLSAGFGAVEDEIDRLKRERTDSQPAQQRSAARPSATRQ